MKDKRSSFDAPARVIRRAGVPEQKVIAENFKELISIFFKSHFGKEGLRRFAENNLPMKKDSGKEKFRKIIMDISFVLLIISVCYIIFYYFGYRGRLKENMSWEELVGSYDNLPSYEIEKLWSDIKGMYPAINFPEDMTIKYARLYAINQDVSGWLQIPNTNISTVVLQSKIYDYYLYRNLYGKYNRYGNPYFDSRCNVSKNGLSKNTIVYGHNTHDGLMFHQLTNYMTLEGYKKAPVVILDTLFEKTQWKIFAVILTNSTSSADNGNLFRYLYSDFFSESHFMNVINGIMVRSMIRTGVDVKPSDKILTLYTCYQNIFPNGRLVVFARQVRNGESPKVDTSNAYFNKDARYPQAYYDKKGLVNPYA